MKVRQMMQEHRHIENWRKDNNPLIRFQALKIKEFYNTYLGRIQTIEKRVFETKKDYFLFDATGEMQFEGEEQNRMPVLQEGKTLLDYGQAIDLIMEETVLD